MKRLLLITIAILSISIGYAQDTLYLPTSTGEIVKHSNYILSYSEAHEQAEWVAYELTASETYKKVNRSDKFKADKTVSTGSASLADYKASGYDRGHLAPAADMCFSSISMRESFYMSNMSPQAPSFNRGVWKSLEGRIRLYAKQSSPIYVVTGPVLTSELTTIGSNSVSVPKYYYKVLLKGRGEYREMIAFLLKNEKSSEPLSSFVVSTDEIEELTGIDFYPQLPDELEEKLESTVDISNWHFEGKPKSQKSYTTTSSAVQCNGIAKSTGVRCKNKTKNSNGYCHHHQSQANSSTVKKATTSSSSGRCAATTKKGTRCKRKASSGSRYCWQHQ